LRVAQSIQAGYIWVNGVSTHFAGVPFGGLKNSGVVREQGLENCSVTPKRRSSTYATANCAASEYRFLGWILALTKNVAGVTIPPGVMKL
jgi:hypothetical protein